jgi:hypothetical protein
MLRFVCFTPVATNVNGEWGVSKDLKKNAVLAMLAKGEATLSEAARLAGVSRQVCANWSKRIDIKAKRDKWLNKRWSRWLHKLGE